MSYSVDYVEKVRSTDHPSYYTIPYWSSNLLTQNILTFLGECERKLSNQKNATYMRTESFQHINNIQSTSGTDFGLDDTETRRKIWRTFSKDALPQVRTDSIQSYYGALDKYVDWRKVDPKKLKGKIEKFLDE